MSMPTLNEIKQQVLLLFEEDRKDLAAFLLIQSDTDAKTGSNGSAFDFSREMDWIRKNRADYRGQFVALKEGSLIAHGNHEREVWQAAVDAGIAVPFLAYIETEAEESFGGW